MGEGNKNLMNDRPHPGLLPQEKEKRAQRLGGAEAPGGSAVFVPNKKAAANGMETNEFSSDVNPNSLSPGERARVRASVQSIFYSALIFFFAFATPLRADDVITNIMSPIVSYQYPENFSSAALTNGGILSPIVSYQYFEWPGDDVLNLKSSPMVSYYYQFSGTPLLLIFSTNRLATVAETTPQYLPPPSSQLEVFTNGIFKTSAALNPNAMTIVLTHGWIPTVRVAGIDVVQSGVKGIDGWPTTIAAQLRANGIASANIVGWDWKDAAKSGLPGTTAARTPDQGIQLGQSLLNALGPNYSKPIHFVGHSFGTLVNAYAANFLHGDRWANEPTNSSPWAATNTQMTLFDEAEVGTGLTTLFRGLDAIAGRNGNPFYPKQSYEHPLPKQFRWADNYVAAVGLLHREAANVILTNTFPANAPSPESWILKLADFHSYPIDWYDETIRTDVSAMGFLWSFERGGWFSQAPATNSVYLQAKTSSEWNLVLTNWAYGTNLMNARFEKYRSAIVNAINNQTPGLVSANGSVTGQNLVGALPAFNSFLLSLVTTRQNSPPQLFQKKSPGQTSNVGGGGITNVPALAWMPLLIPTNAVSMSFNYRIQGEWNCDSLAAALNGTNVLLLAGSQIETNVMFDSGLIDVSACGGKTNEFFVGIIGGTSTNAELTVMNLVFYVAPAPSLSVEASGSGLKVSWPLAAQNFGLEFTTNLTATNSWTAATNVPAVADLQNLVTNPISGGAKFYRLKK